MLSHHIIESIIETVHVHLLSTVLCLIVGMGGIDREVDIFLDFHKVEVWQ